MDFDFNRRCDQYPIGNQKDGALLVSVITPLADDYETYGKEKCVLTTSPQGPEGGFVLTRLGNDESLGRELRTLHSDGEIPHPQERRHPARIDQKHPARVRRRQPPAAERLTRLLGDMLAEGEYFVAGQPLKIKATAPWAALDEAMEYLIQNTFNKMSYLKRLTPRTAQGNPGGPAEQRHRQGSTPVPDRREQPEGHRGRS